MDSAVKATSITVTASKQERVVHKFYSQIHKFCSLRVTRETGLFCFIPVLKTPFTQG